MVRESPVASVGWTLHRGVACFAWAWALAAHAPLSAQAPVPDDDAAAVAATAEASSPTEVVDLTSEGIASPVTTSLRGYVFEPVGVEFVGDEDFGGGTVTALGSGQRCTVPCRLPLAPGRHLMLVRDRMGSAFRVEIDTSPGDRFVAAPRNGAVVVTGWLLSIVGTVVTGFSAMGLVDSLMTGREDAFFYIPPRTWALALAGGAGVLTIGVVTIVHGGPGLSLDAPERPPARPRPKEHGLALTVTPLGLHGSF